jgi:hypothetical protein
MSSTRRSMRATSSSEGIVCIVQSTVTRSGSLGGIMSSTRRSMRATSSSEGIVCIVQSTVTRSGCWFSCSRCSFVRGWFMRGITHLGRAAGQQADVARPTSLLDEATRLKGTSDVAPLVWPVATLKGELTVSTKLITKRLSSSRTRSCAAAYPWVMLAVGELVRCTDGRWMIRPPQHCPRGHPLRPGRNQLRLRLLPIDVAGKRAGGDPPGVSMRSAICRSAIATSAGGNGSSHW